MRILFIGDVFGKPGRRAVKKLLPDLVSDRAIDMVVANLENLSGGHGLDHKRLKEMWEAGVHVATTGNHVWQNKDIFNFIDKEPNLIRPANYPEPCPGKGYTIYRSDRFPPVAVINLLGRVYMPPVDCPFKKAEDLIQSLDSDVEIILVDIHAEATSEKVALGHFLDGRVSLVSGTHTHVQTADEHILPGLTGYISDIGMTGPRDSVIGVRKDRVIERFLSGRPVSFQPAKDDIWLQGIIFSVDDASGRASSIERVNIPLGAGS